MKQKITKKGYKKENKGITLVALVVTIVVLLILAGITITVLFGDNGIIKKVRDASRETKLAEIEEIANLGTINSQIDTIVNNEEKISDANLLTSAINALNSAGYETESREKSGETLEGLTIGGLTSENINLVQGEKATIQVSLDMQGGSEKHYVELDGKFYEMKASDGKVSVSREESTNIDGESYTIKLTNVAEGISLKVSGEGVEEELTAGSIIASGTTIEVTAGETTGNYAFTIGIEGKEHSKETTVVVTQNVKWATSISITSIAPGEIGEELRELEPGATLQLYANILPDTSTDTASWSITKGQDKATISEAGLLEINESAEAESEIEVTATCMRNGTAVTNVTPAKYPITIKVSATGVAVTFADGSKAVLTEGNFGDYLGREVTNYKEKGTGTENVTINSKSYTVSTTYRLYYVDFDGKYGDEGSVYLKADCTENKAALQLDRTVLTSETEGTIKIKALNPGLYNAKDESGIAVNPPASNQQNMEAVTWLTNTNNWNGLKTTNTEDGTKVKANDVKYVVGAPSLEMMMDSYNTHYASEVGNLTEPSATGIGARTSANTDRVKLFYKYPYDSNNYGYAVGPGKAGAWNIYHNSYYTVLSDAKIDTMYYPGNDDYYWLASPSAHYPNRVLFVVYSFGGFVNYNFYDNEIALCPLVCLNPDVQLELAD